jgi:hypothetical protein
MPRDDKRLKATIVSAQKRQEREEACVRLRKEKVRPMPRLSRPSRAAERRAVHRSILCPSHNLSRAS